jgi:hypothetical protein
MHGIEINIFFCFEDLDVFSEERKDNLRYSFYLEILNGTNLEINLVFFAQINRNKKCLTLAKFLFANAWIPTRRGI